MKSPKILFFLTIISLVFFSGWLPVMNAAASPAADGFTTDPTAQKGTHNETSTAETMNVKELPASQSLTTSQKAAIQKLMPQNLSSDTAVFTQSKANAATTLAPVDPKAQQFSAKKGAKSSTSGTSVVSPLQNVVGGLNQDTYAPNVVDNFGGPSMNGYYPADASIAVGPNGLIACVNSAVVGYDKTGLLLYNTPMTTWWSSSLRSGYSLIFNPICKYDALGGRFIIVAALQNASPLVSKYLVSVSQTNSNNGSWYNYAFDATIDGNTASSYFAAFPDVGVDNNAVYITSNQYTASTQAFKYSKIRVFQKSLLYAGTTPGWTDFWNFTNVTTGTTAFSVRAALSLDATNYEYFVDSQANGGSQLSMFRITSANPWVTPVFSKASINTPVTSYSVPPNAYQYDSGVYPNIQTGDSRLLNLVLRNGALWTAHTIAGTSGGGTSVAAIRWYQIDPVAATKIQEGTFLDGDYYSYYYPVITVDAMNDVGLTYNWSGPGDYPSIAFTGRLATDDTGAMEYPQYYFADGVRANTSGRWGAYNGAAVDPTSSKMWFIAQLPGASTTSWTTRIFSSSFAVAQPFNKTAPTDGATNRPVATTLTWSSSTGADNYQYCYDTTNDNACTYTVPNTTTNTSVTLNLNPSTTYYWQVRAVAGVNYTYADGSSTSFRRFTTGSLPGAFSKTAPTNAATNQLIAPTLTWAAASGATNYDYCYSTSSSGCTSSSGTWTNVGNTTSVGLSGLSSSTVYYWQVRADNSVGSTYANSSTAWNFTTGALAGAFNKTFPSNAATNQPLAVTLQWGSSSGASAYQYCFGTSSSACTSSGAGPWTSIATTSVVKSGLAENTTYYWHVKVVNGIGTTWANTDTQWSFTTGSAPAAFNKFSPPINGSTNQPLVETLTWGSSAGATSYEYCYTTTSSSCTSVSGTWNSNGTSTSVTLPTLAEGTTYYWQVRAVSNISTVYAGPTPAQVWSFTTGSLPANFTKTTPANNATNQAADLSLNWAASSGALGDGAISYQYCLYTSTASDCNPGTINWVSTGATTSASLTDLLGSTAYHWQVRAQNNIGYKYADSATTFVFTTGTFPSAFSKTSPTDGLSPAPIKPTLVWGTSNLATSYEYCYSTSSADCVKGGGGTWNSVGANMSFLFTTALTEGQTYYWQVRAVNGVGKTYANGSASYYSFTTGYLPTAFSKTSPSSGSVDQPLAPQLQWNTSSSVSGTLFYEYCLNISSGVCVNGGGGTWTSTTSNNFVTLSTQSQGTKYYWNVRATNPIGTVYSSGGEFNFTTGTLPGAFGKTTPLNSATNQPLSLNLNWGTSTGGSGTTTYEYCYTTASNCTAGTWFNVGSLTTASLSSLAETTGYHWQVRAVNPIGATYADGGSASTSNWLFTTGALPGAFNKTAPANAATGAAVKPTLTWGLSSNATSYDYCYSLSSTDCVDGGGGSWTNQPGASANLTSALAENTTYYWNVRANNTIGTAYSNSGSVYSFTTGALPTAFTKSSPAVDATGVILGPTLQWNASSSVDGSITYEYCINSGNTCSSTAGTWTTVSPSGTSVVLSGLSQLTDYYWQIRATNNVGTTYADGTDSATRHFQTGQAPDAFTKTSPTNAATGQTSSLTISWAASNVSSYEYCVSTSTCTPASTWTTVATNSANLTGLGTAGSTTNYFWQVRATNGIGSTYADSGTVFTFQVGALPGAFTLTSPANGATNQLLAPTLSWGTSSGAGVTYSYCYSLNTGDCDNTGAGPWTSNGTTRTIALSGLSQGTVYYWNAKSINTYGATFGSATARNFTTGSLPLAFGKTTPTTGATGQSLTPTLTWASSTNAASYDYCVSASSSSCTTSWVSTGTNTSVTLGTALSGGTTYYWQVRSNSAAGSTYADGGSSTTGYWSFTTGTPPGAFTKSSPANNATGATQPVTLTWAASSSATSYDLCLTTAPNCNSGPWIGLGNVTTKSLSGLDVNKKYQWQIRANNAIGTTYADGGTAATPGSYNFTTANVTGYPGTFKKTLPADGDTGLGTSVVFSWGSSSSATSYAYCVTTTVNGCTSSTGTWTSAGTNVSALVSGLSASITYYWQVRATNATGTTYADDNPIYDFSFTTADPGFTKTHPSDGLQNVCDDPANVCSGPSNPTRLTYLLWDADPSATGTTHYFYCASSASFTGSACTGAGTGGTGGWVDAGAGTLSTPLIGFAKGATFYWQVRWSNDGGTTWIYADGGSVFSFKTKG